MTRHQRAFRSFWSDPEASLSIGCIECPNQDQCGGQTILGGGFNCLDFCCHEPENCQIVCANAKLFADRVREINGFDLRTPSASPLKNFELEPYIPLFFHGSKRVELLDEPIISIPLYQFFDRYADCRIKSREHLSNAFKIALDTRILLSGVAQDDEVEKWWRLEQKGRLKAINNLSRLGIAMVTTPNFSVTVDRPRWDDMHSMKRIAEVFHEFVSEGLAAALHVNGRAAHDFSRWADYIIAHPEVTHLSYEFTTGTKSLPRMHQHAIWLIDLAKAVSRPLGLVLRGGGPVREPLSTYYQVSALDSSPFEKAVHRSVAVLDEGRRVWVDHPTPEGAPIDELLRENLRISKLWFADSA